MTGIRNAPDAELRDLLRSCLDVPRWIDEVATAAPFASVADLLDRARHAAEPLEPEEIEQALTAHPRIGQRPTGETREAAFSRAEQRAPDADDPELAARIAQGNAAYEDRFGRVFLIRAAGRTRAEIHAEQQRRLALDDAADLRIVAGELREIALLRLERLLSSSDGSSDGSRSRSHITTHVLDAARGVPAAALEVTLEQRADDGWTELGHGLTDADGRINSLGPETVPVGRYRVTFDTGAYFAAQGTSTFYPQVVVVVELTDAAAHYHVPLLLSPFAYSTYRGS
ncbi:MAG TPA: 2-oxo-4-hydroxy-4-carboxy-5-ureidoimidazoline decarboxylase [Actinospica sp.]|nr:2-oxo-4-hydroxy-4-carboxy-5-ureidoimidazoline decarboxylase [Actinospica sp.]